MGEVASVFNANAEVPDFEPIRLEIDGKEYSITAVTGSTLRVMSEARAEVLRHEKDPESSDPTILTRLLASLLDVDASLFEPTDVRVVIAAYRYVQEQIGDRMAGDTVNPTSTEGSAT